MKPAVSVVMEEYEAPLMEAVEATRLNRSVLVRWAVARLLESFTGSDGKIDYARLAGAHAEFRMGINVK